MKNQNTILSESSFLRYVSFSLLYISEGIPIGMMIFAIPAWLAENNKSPMEIAAYLSILFIPWSFKIILAPLMDRYTYLPMGRKRPWIIFSQIFLIISFLSVGFINTPLSNLNSIMVAGFFISFFGALQDIAIDGMAVDIIPAHQQAKANGIMWGSRIIGQSLALLIGTFLINYIGFSKAVASLALVVALLIIIPILFRERKGEKLLPWTKGKPSIASKKAQLTNWNSLLKSLYKVILLPTSLCLGIGMICTGSLSGLMTAFLPIFTVQELDWTNTDYSHVYSTATLIGGFLGMILGGTLIDRLGTKKMILILLVSISFLLGTFVLISGYWHQSFIIYGFVIIYFISTTLLDIAILATAMKISWEKVSASQFTLYMTLNNLGNSLGSWSLGSLKEKFSWPFVIIVIALVPIIAVLIYRMIQLKKHSISIKNFEEKELKTSII